MPRKCYIVAVKSDKQDRVSPRWVDELRNVAGVEVHGAHADQARIMADESAIRTLRAKLTGDFLIEEEFPRSV